jgi:hypothetical protein
MEIRSNWERELRHAIGMLPQIDFSGPPQDVALGVTNSRTNGD